MSRFWDDGSAFARIVRWTPSISVALGGSTYAWVTLTLTLPETVDWTRTILVINGKSVCRELSAGTAANYGCVWRPGDDGTTATVYVKVNSTGTKTWTPECELWILDDGYFAYHLHGNWDTGNASGGYYASTATCGDAAAAARAVLWLVNMDYDTYNASICSDNPCVQYVDQPYRDSNNNSCLYYKDTYGGSNIFYSFAYVYKR